MIIGAIGLGGMGKPMARNLATGGDQVLGYDIDTTAGRELVSDDLRLAGSVREVAEQAELIVTMIPDDDALRQVVFGPDGMLAAPNFSGCLVDLSTTSVAIALEIEAAFADRPGAFLDAAVIGGSVEAARLGRSPIVVGGDPELLAHYMSVLSRLGTWDHVGKTGNGKAIKLLNNMLVGIFTASNAEALSLGLNAGLSLPTMVEHLGNGSGSSTVLKSYMGRYVCEGIYGSGLIGHALMMKDLRLACELADMVDVPAAFLETARQTYASCVMTQGEQRQFPSVFDHFRALAADGEGDPDALGSNKS